MARTTLTADYFFSVVGSDENPENNRTAEVQDYIKRSENIILSYTSDSGDPADGVWVDAICSAIQFDMITRVYFNPAARSSEAMGPENVSFTAPGGLFLLPAEREQLEKLKGRSVRGGLGRIMVTRSDVNSW